MINWLRSAEKDGTPVLWSCAATGCPSGNYINDPQGWADHQAATGHRPMPGRPLCPVAGGT